MSSAEFAESPEDAEIISMIPPHDADAEGAVLRDCMLERDALATVADFLEAEHMYSEAHRRIYEAILALSAAGQSTDNLMVMGWLRDVGRLSQVGGSPYISTILTTTPAAGTTRAYGLRVHALWRLRQVQRLAHRTKVEAFTAGQSASEFCEQTAQGFHELAYVPGLTQELEHIGRPLTEALRNLEAAQREGRKIGQPTGFGRYDRITGGLHKGELTFFAARPGKGKTAVAMQLSTFVASAAQTVAFFSLEMPKEQLVMRASCSEGRVDVSHWRNGTVTVAEWPRIYQASAFIERLPIFVDDTPANTALGIRAKLRRLVVDCVRMKMPAPSLVIVDYLQLMRGSRLARGQGREREVAECAQELKEIAKEFKVSLVVPCQMNRAIETDGKRRPRLADLRESGQIEQAADNIVFIHDTGQDRNVVEWIVEKQRNGPKDIVRVRWDPAYTRFDNLADGEFEDREQDQ